MQYQGGKAKLAKRIAAEVEALGPDRTYLEPFVGGGSVLAATHEHEVKPRYAGDENRALITMWVALQNGWTPPGRVTEAQWRAAKAAQDPEDPMTAFLGVACSFMGMWFSSPAPQLAERGQRTLLKKARCMQDVQFLHTSYREHQPRNAIVYCDPPYANTAGYAAAGDFDHSEFWGVMEGWAADGNIVLVSEYSAPDWVPVHKSWEIPGGMARGAKRTENLYLLRRE